PAHVAGGGSAGLGAVARGDEIEPEEGREVTALPVSHLVATVEPGAEAVDADVGLHAGLILGDRVELEAERSLQAEKRGYIGADVDAGRPAEGRVAADSEAAVLVGPVGRRIFL